MIFSHADGFKDWGFGTVSSKKLIDNLKVKFLYPKLILLSMMKGQKLKIGFSFIVLGLFLCIGIIALTHPIDIAEARHISGCAYQGNPRADSDGDTFSDGYELNTGSDLCDPCSPDRSKPACGD